MHRFKLEHAVGRSAERLGIGGRLSDKAGALSRGLRQRLAIAQAIIHEPTFLLLDEPASGLDPEARHSLALLFRQLQARGMTLLVSSHILSELEEYSTDMLVLRAGRIIEHAPLATADRTAVMELRLSLPFAGLGALLTGVTGLALLQADDSKATFSCTADPSGQHLLLRELLERGVPVCSFGEQKQNLQDAYLRTVSSAEGKGVGR